MNAIVLDGNSVTLQDLVEIAGGSRVRIHSKCRQKVNRARKVVENFVSGKEPVYGVNTGLGFFAKTRIDNKDLIQLQKNIIRSHAGGTGKALSLAESRCVLALRLNLLLKGHSGVRYTLCETMEKWLARGVLPFIPEYGSVGASGDLIPLAHVGLGIMGEGLAYYKGKAMAAKAALARAKLKPLELGAREGLASINGTEVMQAIGGLALAKALKLETLAHKIAALTYEGLCARPTVLDDRIHKMRRQVGQREVAALMRQYLKGSYLHDKGTPHRRLQDPYSIRCVPQVHGPSRDALNYTQTILEREFNALTDNPLVFPDSNPQMISGGNFHGQPLSFIFDIATMACTQLANISDRRLEVLSNPTLSGLPAFLAPNEGLDSGYMVLQYLSAASVSECKILSHPASCDSISGNVGIEDFVSMGMTSAHKLRKVVELFEMVLATELLAACQAIDLRKVKKLGQETKKLYVALRKKVKMMKQDRVVSNDVNLSREVIAEVL